MTNNEDEQENETYVSSYGGFLVNPKYQATVIDVGSGALTSRMLTEAAHKARTMDFSSQHGLISSKAMKILIEQEEERKIRQKFDSTPVGQWLKD